MTTSLQKLTLPKSIVSSNEDDDSFSRDLLRQFDKRRSRLHFELGFTSQEPSPESSLIQTPQSESYSDQEPVQLDQIEEIQQQQQQQQKQQQSSNETSKRASTASDLLRRSSAYLKSKLELIKKTNQNRSRSSSSSHHPELRPTKLLMKTTISIPSSTATKLTSTNPSSSIIPSLTTITQYPPKPLVYSPIEPISDESPTQKPLLHRISMPLMRVYNDSSISRHKSIASFVNRRRKSEPDHHSHKKK
ncbi:MAG: hypothetical protein EXX96DRAFT_586045 [Benjaminiella poitrasii]|nr:MAG: hypothetical protein EXX96DRAFT_586045 [Benjaminiella poitrasii]